MGQHTSIEWCHHTFNPWWGCEKIAQGCKNCYAERQDKWLHKGAHWGPGAPRRYFGRDHWKEPLRWDRWCADHAERRRVFCGSMCDVLDPAADAWELQSLFELMRKTPNLDWLLLSKRPERYRPTFERLGCPDNIWAGASASTQAECDEACRHLQYLPTRVEFLSLEPLIEKVIIPPLSLSSPGDKYDGIADRIDWVIVGGESGPGARPCDTEWIEQIVRQCDVHRLPVFVKQLGKRSTFRGLPLNLSDPKGGEPGEWFDEDLRVRQVPDGQAVWP